VNVLAAASGRVLRTRDGVADASFRVEGRNAITGKECGNGVVIDHADGWQTQYCHMERQTVNVKSGDEVHAGQPLGRVGLSGLTEFPHLHFTVRHQGKVVDPFAYGADAESCRTGISLWDRAAKDALSYRSVSVLNMGFATGPVTMETIESGEAALATPSLDSAVLVAYVRAIGLKAGDVPRIAITGADGGLLADVSANPMDHDKAQHMMFAGKRRPVGGWPRGRYHATYSIRRGNAEIVERSSDLVL
jgi:Peptidase family M23